jgi:medium-chain acyl-[acyl-carrier-protein] hydrolase
LYNPFGVGGTSGMRETSSWLLSQLDASDNRVRLFCLPHAGGGATAFRFWKINLPSFVQVCPILLPGREARIAEDPYTDLDSLVEALTQELLPWLDQPFAIFGHSMGALLAFEWARSLRRTGQFKPSWIFLSGRAAPDKRTDASLRLLPDDEFLEELNRRYQGIPQELLDAPELMQVFLPILRADISVVESYQFEEDTPLECPVTVFGGVNDRMATYDQLFAWKRHTSERFQLQLFPGGHFYPQVPMLEVISATLNEVHG